MADLTLKKGFTIRLQGEAPVEIKGGKPSRLVAIQPPDFHGFKPKLAAREGDSVKIGSPLLYEKSNDQIKFTSPVSGKVVAVNRGARRAILSIVVESDGQDAHHDFTHVKSGDVGSMDREAILNAILESGLFPQFVSRPFGVLADPTVTPRDIFVSLMDTAPLAADPLMSVVGNEESFILGTKVINKLTNGAVHLGVPKDRKDMVQKLIDTTIAVPHTVSGQHPAGNPGVQIHHIAPIKDRNDVVWTISAMGVILIGRLFAEGKLMPEVTVAVAGSDAKEVGYYKTVLGASVSAVIGEGYDDAQTRVISGSPLNGRAIGTQGFLGFRSSSLSLIPEVNEPRFFATEGWASPGVDKGSYWGTFLGKWLNPRGAVVQDTCLSGGVRNFVITGHYENVVPMDLYPAHLIKSIMYQDIEEMEGLGIYEVIEEDIALCEYICPSKVEMQDWLRKGLDYVEKEG